MTPNEYRALARLIKRTRYAEGERLRRKLCSTRAEATGRPVQGY